MAENDRASGSAPAPAPRARRASARKPAAAANAKPTAAATADADANELPYLLGRRTEDVAAAFISLASELWIVKDRIAVLERVLEKHGIPAPEAVDRYEPEPEFKARLDAERRAWTRRIVAALFPTGLPKVDP